MTYDEDTGRWAVEVTNPDGSTETIDARAVISAVGSLNSPRMPDIPGMDDFEGPSFHSARWDHSVDYAGKQFALVGAGASGFQIAPTIADDVAQLTVYQRTAQWVFPNPNYHRAVPDGERWAIRHLPFFGRWFRFLTFYPGAGLSVERNRIDPEWDDGGHSVSEANAATRELFAALMLAQLGDDDELKAKVLPDYPPTAKRMLQDNGSWLACLRKDNVELVRTGIERIVADGMITVDGTFRPADIICYATGFRHNDFLWPMHIVGHDGAVLREEWGDRTRRVPRHHHQAVPQPVLPLRPGHEPRPRRQPHLPVRDLGRLRDASAARTAHLGTPVRWKRRRCGWSARALGVEGEGDALVPRSAWRSPGGGTCPCSTPAASAAAALALVDACSARDGLTVLATSTSAVGGTDEVVHAVAPLPDAEATRLFLDRAAAAAPQAVLRVGPHDRDDVAGSAPGSTACRSPSSSRRPACVTCRSPSSAAGSRPDSPALDRAGPPSRHRTWRRPSPGRGTCWTPTSASSSPTSRPCPARSTSRPPKPSGRPALPRWCLRLLDRSFLLRTGPPDGPATFRMLAALRAFAVHGPGPGWPRRFAPRTRPTSPLSPACSPSTRRPTTAGRPGRPATGWPLTSRRPHLGRVPPPGRSGVVGTVRRGAPGALRGRRSRPRRPHAGRPLRGAAGGRDGSGPRHDRDGALRGRSRPRRRAGPAGPPGGGHPSRRARRPPPLRLRRRVPRRGPLGAGASRGRRAARPRARRRVDPASVQQGQGLAYRRRDTLDPDAALAASPGRWTATRAPGTPCTSTTCAT